MWSPMEHLSLSGSQNTIRSLQKSLQTEHKNEENDKRERRINDKEVKPIAPYTKGLSLIVLSHHDRFSLLTF